MYYATLFVTKEVLLYAMHMLLFTKLVSIRIDQLQQDVEILALYTYSNILISVYINKTILFKKLYQHPIIHTYLQFSACIMHYNTSIH